MKISIVTAVSRFEAYFGERAILPVQHSSDKRRASKSFPSHSTERTSPERNTWGRLRYSIRCRQTGSKQLKVSYGDPVHQAQSVAIVPLVDPDQRSFWVGYWRFCYFPRGQNPDDYRISKISSRMIDDNGRISDHETKSKNRRENIKCRRGVKG